jgi:hypothetical protein
MLQRLPSHLIVRLIAAYAKLTPYVASARAAQKASLPTFSPCRLRMLLNDDSGNAACLDSLCLAMAVSLAFYKICHNTIISYCFTSDRQLVFEHRNFVFFSVCFQIMHFTNIT